MSNIPTITVISEGQPINNAYLLLAIEAHHQINKIASAKLTYIDTDDYPGKFKLTKDEVFQPGKSLIIKARYEGDAANERVIFEGVIVKHQIKFDKNRAVLILELRHTAINLTITRTNTVFIDKSDEDIFEEIGTRYLNVKCSSDVVSEKHRQMIQSWCTDWDFILSRAENNGWWLVSDVENSLKLIDPAKFSNLLESKVILDLNAGSQIYAFDMAVDILNQVAKVSAVSWDVDKQEVVNEALPIEQKTNFIKFEGGNDYTLYHCGDLSQKELKAWLHSKQIKNDFALFKGKIRILGELNIKPGMVIKLNNIGTYFHGNHVVSSVKHLIDKEHGFQTEIGIGLSIDSLISMQNVDAPAAGGMLPSIGGLQIGVVKGYDDIDKDKKNLLLVKVKLPLFGTKDNEVWARLSSIYAGSEYGVVFRPEIGDEVVLGFFNDDPRYPVILGSMYSAKNKPPIQFEKENDHKAIVTKEKLTLLLKDKTKAIELMTSKNNKVIIATEGESPGISVEDENKNSLICNADGITCFSKSNTKIKSEQSVIIEAAKVEVK